MTPRQAQDTEERKGLEERENNWLEERENNFQISSKTLLDTWALDLYSSEKTIDEWRKMTDFGVLKKDFKSENIGKSISKESSPGNELYQNELYQYQNQRHGTQHRYLNGYNDYTHYNHDGTYNHYNHDGTYNHYGQDGLLSYSPGSRRKGLHRQVPSSVQSHLLSPSEATSSVLSPPLSGVGRNNLSGGGPRSDSNDTDSVPFSPANYHPNHDLHNRLESYQYSYTTNTREDSLYDASSIATHKSPNLFKKIQQPEKDFTSKGRHDYDSAFPPPSLQSKPSTGAFKSPLATTTDVHIGSIKATTKRDDKSSGNNSNHATESVVEDQQDWKLPGYTLLCTISIFIGFYILPLLDWIPMVLRKRLGPTTSTLSILVFAASLGFHLASSRSSYLKSYTHLKSHKSFSSIKNLFLLLLLLYCCSFMTGWVFWRFALSISRLTTFI